MTREHVMEGCSKQLWEVVTFHDTRAPYFPLTVKSEANVLQTRHIPIDFIMFLVKILVISFSYH